MADSKSLYSLRGEPNLEKIRSDIITGALAEFAVYNYLTEKGIKVSAPDLKIYETKKKSFAADLKSEDKHFHVKSQTVVSAKRHGTSWLFQKQDKLLTLPSETGYIAFCLVDGTKVEIKAIVHIIEMIEANVISEPRIPRYQMTKSAIYLDDVLNSGINLWRV